MIINKTKRCNRKMINTFLGRQVQNYWMWLHSTMKLALPTKSGSRCIRKNQQKQHSQEKDHRKLTPVVSSFYSTSHRFSLKHLCNRPMAWSWRMGKERRRNWKKKMLHNWRKWKFCNLKIVGNYLHVLFRSCLILLSDIFRLIRDWRKRNGEGVSLSSGSKCNYMHQLLFILHQP